MRRMPRLPSVILALALSMSGCSAVLARQDFEPSDFSMAYIRPATRAEAPTVASRAVTEELKGFDRAFGRLDGAVKGLAGSDATKVKAQAAAVRALLDRDWRARLRSVAAQQTGAFSDLVLKHDVLGNPGHVPLQRAPGDDAESKAANAALAEADQAVKAATRAEVAAGLARNMLALAHQDLEEARLAGEPRPVQVAAAAYAAVAAARLALDALHETQAALPRLAAAEKRLVAAATANTTVGMRLGGGPGRVTSARGVLEALRTGMPATIEGAARVLADAKALKR